MSKKLSFLEKLNKFLEILEERDLDVKELAEEEKPIEIKISRIKDLKIRYWIISEEDILKKKLIIIDIDNVIKNLKSDFDNEDLIEFGFIKEKDQYRIKYVTSERNENLINDIENLINRIKKREVTIKTIPDEIKKIKSLIREKKEEDKSRSEDLDYISDSYIKKIQLNWNKIAKNDKEKLFNYVSRLRRAKIEKEDVIKKLKQLQKITEMVRIKYYVEKGRELLPYKEALIGVDIFWDNLDKRKRESFLITIVQYKRISDNFLEANWIEISETRKDRIIDALIDFRNFLDELTEDFDLKEEIKESKKEGKKTVKKIIIDPKERLKEHILGIICDVLINSDWDKVFQKYLYGRLYGIGYFDSDFTHILEMMKILEEEGIIKKSHTYYESKVYYILNDEKAICEEKKFDLSPIISNIPLLYDFPDIEDDDISKRVIIQILCENCKGYNKNRALSLDPLRSRWIKFFKYKYKLKGKGKEYNYLIDDLNLKDDEILNKFNKDLYELIDDKIIVKSSPPPRYNIIIRLQKNYDFIWKTFKFGIFSEIQEISSNTYYLNDETINDFKQKNQYNHFKNIIDTYGNSYIILYHNKYPIYIIYDYRGFKIIEYEDFDKDKIIRDLKLDIERNKMKMEIIEFLQDPNRKEKINKTEFHNWKSLRNDSVLNIDKALKF